jgi:hypothetical protein
MPQRINGLVSPGKKNPTIFFSFLTWLYQAGIEALFIENTHPMGSFYRKK